MTVAQWTMYILAFAGLIAFIVMRRRGQISKREAAGYVKQGACVVDVRSTREFNSGHLLQALNAPLEELEGLVPQRIKDKNRVILVHCRTGLRSKQAKVRLERIGYQHVFILGSYERAFKIVSGTTL
jgi:rhodanese-related sulfurtransferase